MEFVTQGATRLRRDRGHPAGCPCSTWASPSELTQVGYQDWITCRSPDDNEQKFFGIAHDAAVFEIFRTGFDQRKKPMRVTVTVFPTDRNQFIVNVGDVPESSVRHGGREHMGVIAPPGLKPC